MWGELASHKRSLTHRPSSQGWASSYYMFVCLGYGWVGCFTFFSFLFFFKLVCYAHVFPCIYMYEEKIEREKNADCLGIESGISDLDHQQ